jgi:hypothetical protein
MKVHLITLVVAVFTAALPPAHAQAPPGPIRSQPSRPSSNESRTGASPEDPKKEDRNNEATRTAKPAAPERKTIAGSWKLNHSESDDVRLKFRAAYQQRAQEHDQQDPWGSGRNGPYGNGPYGRNPPGRGDPWPGGGGWGGGTYDPRPGHGQPAEPREDDLEGLEEFMFPPEAVIF